MRTVLLLFYLDLGMRGGEILTPISGLTTPMHGDLPGLPQTPIELNIMPECRYKF